MSQEKHTVTMGIETTDSVVEGGFGDFKAKIQGTQSIMLIILAASLCATGYLFMDYVKDNRVVSHEEHLTIQQGIDEMVYVQSLTDEERKKLNLTMPESLVKKRKSMWEPTR